METGKAHNHHPWATAPQTDNVFLLLFFQKKKRFPHPRDAKATPVTVIANAVNCRTPNGSPSSTPDDSTPITGTISVPIAAVLAGSSFNALNHVM